MTWPGEQLMKIWNVFSLEAKLLRLLKKIKADENLGISWAHRDEFKKELKMFELLVDISKQKQTLSYMKEVNDEGSCPIFEYMATKELTHLSEILKLLICIRNE